MNNPHHHPRPHPLFLATALATLLPACTVGPDHHKPEIATPAAFAGLDGSLAGSSDAITNTPSPGAANVAVWWTVFNDPTLTTLIAHATETNLDLAAAETRIRQARATRIISGAAAFPNLGANGSASRGRSGESIGNSFRAGFDASWEIDIFGAVRRSVEAADAGLQSAIEDRRDVMVTLAGEVASTYLDLRGAQQQLLFARRNLATQVDTLSLTQERFEVGFVSGLDVANAKAQAASTTSRIPPLEATVRNSIYALSILLGREPSALTADLSPDGPVPVVPTDIPIGLPSDLLQRRPDIRRAEANLHAATARIGVATADLFPRFSLNGSVGQQGGSPSQFASIANRYWSIGPSVSWTALDGGRIRGNITLQKAAAEEALIAYKKTILIALQDVEVALVNFAKEQQRHSALIGSVDANREAVDLATELYSAGRTDFLNVLSAQRQLSDSEDSLSQSERIIATNLVSLYKALGGGWSE